MKQLIKSPALGLLAALLLSACVQNPVTGKKDFLLVSEGWELQIGAQQYLPLRQGQGGDYVVDPGVEKYVRSIGNRLAAKSDRKLPYEFNVINDSTPNAWALPGGKISINRGLLVRLKSESELAAVLGHEIVHAAAKHGARGQTRGIGLQLGVVAASILGAREGYGQEAQLLSSVGAQIINSRYGQSAELEADRYGMSYMTKAGFDAQGAVGLQRTFVQLSKGQPSDPISRLFASHPPSEKRVAENIKTARSLKSGGIVGEKPYRKAMAHLFKTRKAYDSFDRAQIALNKNQPQQATALLRDAIRLEPREAHFHALLGDIALTRNNLPSAKRSFDKAIALNAEYYYYYLQRGKIYEKQRNARAAQADFARSEKLMPTSGAQLSLGRYAELSGRPQVAKHFYALAAQARGDDANKARTALLRLAPPPTKETRLLIRQGLSQRGTFGVVLINQTSQDIHNVRLSLQSAPGTPQREVALPGVILAGKSRSMDTGRQLTRQQAQQIRVTILSADVVR